jgi:hypothetical protein
MKSCRKSKLEGATNNFSFSVSRIRTKFLICGWNHSAGDAGGDETPDDSEVAAESIEGFVEEEVLDILLLDAETNSKEYIKLKVKQLLPLAVDSMNVQLFTEHVNLPIEIDDEVRQRCTVLRIINSFMYEHISNIIIFVLLYIFI